MHVSADQTFCSTKYESITEFNLRPFWAILLITKSGDENWGITIFILIHNFITNVFHSQQLLESLPRLGAYELLSTLNYNICSEVRTRMRNVMVASMYVASEWYLATSKPLSSVQLIAGCHTSISVDYRA